MKDVQAPPTVFVIDDDASYRRLITSSLEAEGFAVESFDSGQSFLDNCAAERRGCALIDLAMPEIHGAALLAEMRTRGYHMPAIILTGTADVPTAVSVLRQGAVDLFEKQCETPALAQRIREVIKLDAQQAVIRAVRQDQAQRLARLTARERQVMELAIEGQANKQIARILAISERTVEVHRSRVMRKMEVESLAVLVSRHVTNNSAAA